MTYWVYCICTWAIIILLPNPIEAESDAQTPKWNYKNKVASIAHPNSTLSVKYLSEKQKLVIALYFRYVSHDTLDRYETVKVGYSVDNQLFETKYWTWESSKMCFVESSDLIKKLMEGSIVEVRVYDQTDYAKNKNKNFQAYQFSLKGSATAIQQVLNSVPKTYGGTITGEWWDQKWKSSMRIYRKSGKIFMDHSLSGVGVEIEKCAPPKSNMNLSDWTTFTMIDRIGEPDIKYSINHTDGKLYYYLNCEFGPCNLSRVMERTK